MIRLRRYSILPWYGFTMKSQASGRVSGHFVTMLLLVCIAMSVNASEIPDDPLQSSQWETMYKAYLKDAPVVFDDRIRVLAPKAVEDSLEVPVMVDIVGLDNVEQVLVFADFNPLPKVLEFFPVDAEPRIGFRMKLQQASPIRAAVRAGDSVWHVGGVWVDAAGGGCTLPSVGSANPQWESRLGEINARLWLRDKEHQRLRFSVLHPMDTGLAPGIPAFYAESIELSDDKDQRLATIKPYEPISENPLFTLDLPAKRKIFLSGRDNDGNLFNAQITP